MRPLLAFPFIMDKDFPRIVWMIFTKEWIAKGRTKNHGDIPKSIGTSVMGVEIATKIAGLRFPFGWR
ncbi:hypothetical protein ES707_07100 [subsurface metagenome]